MERQTYIQLDRMERNQMKIIEGIKLLINKDKNETITNFFNDEIMNSEGLLSHLRNDEKVKAFYANLLPDNNNNYNSKDDGDASNDDEDDSQYIGKGGKRSSTVNKEYSQSDTDEI